MEKKEKRFKILSIQYMSLLIGAAVFLIIIFLCVAADLPLFAKLERGLLDFHFQEKVRQITEASTLQEGVSQAARLDPRLSRDIVIVGIDEQSLEKLGPWRWKRGRQARILQSTARLRHQENRERALLMDFFYTEDEDPVNDRALLDGLRENQRVFLETVPDAAFFDPGKSDSEREQIYSGQDALFEKHGVLSKISGDWSRADAFMYDMPPLPEFGKLTRGYGHASYLADDDQIYRRAILVARCSRLVDAKSFSVENLDLRAAVKELQPRREAFEWVAWKDVNGWFNPIEENALRDDVSRKTLEQAMLANGVRDDQGKSFRLRKFKDYFVPSIVLSLALEYYHKTLDDVEVVYGDCIRIPNPEVYVRDDPDPRVLTGGWQPLTGADGRPQKEIRIPIDGRGAMLINFMGISSEVSKTFRVSSFWNFGNPQVIPAPETPEARRPISRGLDNKIVIVCAFAKGIGMAMDVKNTPVGELYGGEVHANAINTILMSNYLTPPPVWLTLALIFFAVFLTAFISSRLPPILSLVMIGWFAAVYFIAVSAVFTAYNSLLIFSAPAIGMALTFLLIVAYRVIFEEQDKRRIKGMFGKYVPPAVVEQLLVNPPELGGVDKDITVLFSDIRGFTTLSETMTPQALVNHLNIYLTRMTDVIFDYYGTLDKYVGDEVMCFWGAPLPQKEHAILACQCALKQIEELHRLNDSWPPEKRINIGIGINSGIMTVGNMGSPGRMNYTLMGDECNLGARLEGTNKEYGTTIIISERTFGLVKDRVVVRELDNIRVKGKNKPVLIYELIDVPEGLDPPKQSAVY